MLLPDHEIRAVNGFVTPFNDRNVQPASYDLTLDGDVVLWPSWIPFRRGYQLLSTREYIRLPADIQGQVHGRSSLAREGVMVHISAGFIDPGFCGTITLETVYFGSWFKKIRRGTRVAQVAYLKLSSPAVTPYNSNRNHYQFQEGPTRSRRHPGEL